MKFLYCPRCKDVRVKGWYQFRPACPRCMHDATMIVVKNSWLTYLSYGLYFVIIGFVAFSMKVDDRTYLYFAIALLVVAGTAAYLDMLRGEKLARKRVKIADSNVASFRRRGWV